MRAQAASVSVSQHSEVQGKKLFKRLNAPPVLYK